ncbi:hypothetical protein E2C01_020829 [Portunus trituberculatus]|uniref:Uncharacterized protein n=1 Tax=Portunus trituberculatus TaxID=210409 RepID=A0A5B7E0Y8_PORTR|nr:hypothetical protein [Portunus trituberculatus]
MSRGRVSLEGCWYVVLRQSGLQYEERDVARNNSIWPKIFLILQIVLHRRGLQYEEAQPGLNKGSITEEEVHARGRELKSGKAPCQGGDTLECLKIS